MQMGLHGQLAPGQAHAVDRIRGCIADALSIIHNLLELSGTENGSLPVEKREIDLARLLAEVADEYRAAAGAAGRALHVDVSGPVWIATDPARVRQILGNLVSNAIKYARGSDRIILSAGLAAEGAREGQWAAVRVKDFGPGIPAGEIDRLFEEFYRAQANGDTEGHGLGLAVSRRIAHLLDGDLTAESEVGRGAVFTLWLPVHDGTSVLQAAAARSGGDRRRAPGRASDGQPTLSPDAPRA